MKKECKRRKAEILALYHYAAGDAFEKYLEKGLMVDGINISYDSKGYGAKKIWHDQTF